MFNKRFVALLLLSTIAINVAVFAKSSGMKAAYNAVVAELNGASANLLPATGTVELAFSPKGGATDAVVNAIREARRSILVQAYSFTSAPIAKALVDAKARGVDVKVILDKSQNSEKYSSASFIANHDIPVRIDSLHAIAHNKIIICDEINVVTGSFNFTKAAEEKNAENVLVLRGNEALAKQYVNNWQVHWAHSQEFMRRF
ncbi:phospholipase D family nuclease [Sulfurirhabdus autotrophica]|uniref:phospholipase D n=1 Tax=Sulfurirhabdus autotrophica TaxID=1706046 RepID=A0A4V2W0Y0_9PROT|nr:phospholipase D family protein [Sulfurirhabdus autotrophica]TCV81245.1 phospholipase D-like protein [Sulfurirhabdus autotrophica]